MPRRRKAVPAETSGADTVLLWATTQNAPIRLLEGWDPDTGAWSSSSPVGLAIAAVQQAVHPSTAGKLANMPEFQRLVQRGRDFDTQAPENRDYVQIDIRPFVDLARAVDQAEAVAEVGLVQTVVRGTKIDPKLALALLGRRFPDRWREQQQTIITDALDDDRSSVITEAITDPATAMQLAAVAHAIEDRAAAADRDD